MPRPKDSGRKAKYTAETISAAYQDYLQGIAEHNSKAEQGDKLYPTIEGFRGYLDVTPATYDSYAEPSLYDIPNKYTRDLDITEDIYNQYKEYNSNKITLSNTVKKINSDILDKLWMVALNNPKAASIAIYLSKQKSYGGYTDKQQVESIGKVDISFSLKGSDGKPL